MSGPPGRPAPPVLVNATATSLLLAWFAPHHGGEEVLLYWLVLTPTPIRTLALTLTTEPKQVLLYRLRMWRGTRWLNLYVGARANHTVHYLEQGTAHLFRLQATLAPSLPPLRVCTRWLSPLCNAHLSHPLTSPTHLSHPPLSLIHLTHPYPPVPTHTGCRHTMPTGGAPPAPPPPSPLSRGRWPATPRRRACRASMPARACVAASSTWQEDNPSDRAAAWVARCASTTPNLVHTCHPLPVSCYTPLTRCVLSYHDALHMLPSYHPLPGARRP